MSQKVSPAEHVSPDYLTVVICCMWWTWLYHSVYLLQVVDWTPKEHCGGGEPDLGTVELLRERRAKLCEIRLWEEMSGQRLIFQSSNRFGTNFLSLSFFSLWLSYYLPAFGFSFLFSLLPRLPPSFFPSATVSRAFFPFRFFCLIVFSFILFSTLLSFFLPAQLFPILPRFLSHAVKRIKLHLLEPRNQTPRLKTTTHCVSQQGNQTGSLRDHNYGWRSGALCIKFNRLVLLFIEEWLFSISSRTKVRSYDFPTPSISFAWPRRPTLSQRCWVWQS